MRLELGRVSSERKRELFSGAACVVLPYTSSHSHSGVLADSYTYRVPLVVSDVGAIGPTVREDKTGRVVAPLDPAALAEALAAAVAEPAASAAQMEAALRRHDPRQVGAAMRAVYDQAVTS